MLLGLKTIHVIRGGLIKIRNFLALPHVGQVRDLLLSVKYSVFE